MDVVWGVDRCIIDIDIGMHDDDHDHVRVMTDDGMHHDNPFPHTMIGVTTIHPHLGYHCLSLWTRGRRFALLVRILISSLSTASSFLPCWD